ncbi:MAG: DegQ family serine endoprotease [Rhodocyclaceae bacterium]|nr:DegQ family serine endoprotease [Rhodocyclaceae bacterium]
MNIRVRRIALSLALAVAFAGGYALQDHVVVGTANAAAPVAEKVLAETPHGVSVDFSDIVATQGPAVVNISVSGSVKTALPALPEMDPDSPFYEFFRRFAMPIPRGHAERVPTHGLGSGFIVSPDGIVLTNAHVVADADEVVVKLTDKREFKAKVVGIDKQTDVAVLRIPAQNLPAVKIGDPAKTRVGEWVVAIGSPFGFENSVTAGIVSAKSRTLPDDGYVPFMQTDVAINPGNSGGPLLNMRGEVIGINSQIYSGSGGYQGLSFAIPIDVAMNVEQQLLAKGKVSRGRLGITIQEVDQALADSFGLDKPRGALVSSVEPGSPAAKAGLQSGDIILRFNGKEIAQSAELPMLVGGTPPGQQAQLEIWRKGASRTLTAALGEMKPATAKGDEAGAQEAPAGRLNLALRPLTREERSEVEGGTGLIVEDVGDGPAARSGIRPGDVILAANGERVASVAQLRKQLEHAGKRVALLVQRNGRTLFVPVSLG